MTLTNRVLWTLLALFFLPTFILAQDERPSISGKEPISITAEKLEYLKDQDQFVAEGSVEVEQGSLRLTADHALLNQSSKFLKAKGQVRFFDGFSHLTADEIEYDFNSDQGVLLNGTLSSVDGLLFLKARRLRRISRDRYEMEESTFTTCQSDECKIPLWSLRARKAQVRIGGTLTARDVFLELKGIPVFYFPYLVLPAITDRQTGFLIPRLGYGSHQGFKIKEDFYWAIAPNQDATFSLDYRSARGAGGGIEYRYIPSRLSEGTFRTSYFNNTDLRKKQIQTDWQHRHVLSRDLFVRLDLHLVNDADQFRDLSQTTSDRVKSTLDSNLILYYRRDNHFLYLLSQITQDLYPTVGVGPKKSAVQKIPEVGYSLQAYSLGGLPLFFEVDTTGTYFWMEDEEESFDLVRAQRFDLFPRMIGKLGIGAWSIRQRVGWHETWYSRSVGENSPVRRTLPVADVRSDLLLWKSIEVSGQDGVGRLIHSIKPSVLYEYVPKRDQDDLPKFDARDQINAKNLITYSIHTRLISHFKLEESAIKQRRELLMLKFTQSYDLRERRREAPDNTVRPYSNLRSELTLRPFPDLRLEMDSFHNLYDRQIVMFNLDLKASISDILRLSLGRRLTREGVAFPIGDGLNPLSQSDEGFWYTGSSPAIHFYTASIRMDVPIGLALVSNLYYDQEERSFAEANYGIEYDGDCWAFGLSYIDLPNENEVSFFITLKTAGLATLKSTQGIFGDLP